MEHLCKLLSYDLEAQESVARVDEDVSRMRVSLQRKDQVISKLKQVGA